MPNELENAVKDAALKVAKYVEDVATLTVETRYVEVGQDGAVNFDQARPAARTTIKLDGDCAAVVPMRASQTGPEVDAALFDLHQRNVTMAIDYRARMVGALWSALQPSLKKS
jgi:hypothetical protein